MTFTELARRYPPVLCRLLAMRGGAGGVSFVLTTEEIMARSGIMDEFTVKQISRQASWAEIPLGLMQKFLTGCGLDFEDWRKMRKFHEFMKRVGDRNRGWGHLRRSPEWLSYYELLLAIFSKSQAVKEWGK